MTLHWFVHPRWFDKLGGFTKAANIAVYVEWAETAFKLFGDHLCLILPHLTCTTMLC